VAWSRESRHARGYGTAWDKLRKRILARDKHLCQPCLRASRVTPASQVDHITPKAKGGTDDEGNLEAICAECHMIKTAKESGRPLRQRQVISLDGWPVED
jgi:5-methylcytosine-specific restriction protein A